MRSPFTPTPHVHMAMENKGGLDPIRSLMLVKLVCRGLVLR